MNVGEILKAINNPIRKEILHWLKEPAENFDLTHQIEGQQVDADKHGVCVSLIHAKTGLSQSTVSAYLANLQRANLVTSTRIGGWTYYKRNEEEIRRFVEYLENNL